MPSGDGVGDLRRLRVVLADDHDDLVSGMVERREPFEGRAEHGRLVACGNDERERGGGLPAKWEGGAPELLRRAPRVEHPGQRRCGDRGQRQRDERVEDVEVDDPDPLGRARGVSPTDSRSGGSETLHRVAAGNRRAAARRSSPPERAASSAARAGARRHPGATRHSGRRFLPPCAPDAGALRTRGRRVTTFYLEEAPMPLTVRSEGNGLTPQPGDRFVFRREVVAFSEVCVRARGRPGRPSSRDDRARRTSRPS